MRSTQPSAPSINAVSPRITRLHLVRVLCHAFLFLFSLTLLIVAAVVLAYSIRVYRGSFLHSTPELLTAAGLALVVLACAWVPTSILGAKHSATMYSSGKKSKRTFGLSGMGSVWVETLYLAVLSLCFFGGVTSLHKATPGLLTTCGGFFICRGYTALLILSWLAWLCSTTCLVLLFTSAVYQRFRRNRQGVWRKRVADWDWYWPDESGASISSAANTNPSSPARRISSAMEQREISGFSLGRASCGGGGRGANSEDAPKIQPHAPHQPARAVFAPKVPLEARGGVVKKTQGFELPPEHLAPGYDGEPPVFKKNRSKKTAHERDLDPELDLDLDLTDDDWEKDAVELKGSSKF